MPVPPIQAAKGQAGRRIENILRPAPPASPKDRPYVTKSAIYPAYSPSISTPCQR